MNVLNKPYRIVIVDDNEGDVMLIQEYLEEFSPAPISVVAKSLRELESLIQKDNTFDAILLDLALPDASGQDLVQKVIRLIPNIPIIVLTGYTNKEFGIKAVGLGVSDYLQKDDLNSYVLIKSISYSIERTRINRTLRTSEQQYRDLFDFNPLPMWVYDLNTLQFLNVNEVAIKHYGYSREEFLSMTIKEIRPEEDIPKLLKAIEYVKKENKPDFGIFRHRKKNGDIIFVEISGNVIEYLGSEAELILANDITQQLEKEETLRESLERYDIIAKATSDTIWDLNLVTGVIRYNRVFNDMFGYDTNEIADINSWWSQQIHPEDLEHVKKMLEEIMLNQDHRIEFEYRFKCADGTYKYVNDRAFVVTDDIGKNPVRMLGAMQDITQRKEEENRLRMFESIITHTNDAVLVTEPFPADDGTRRILYANEAFSRITGYTNKEVIGRGTGFLSGKNSDAAEIERIRSNMNQFLPTVTEILNYKKSGEEIWVHASIMPIFNDKNECSNWIYIIRDVTERKSNQEKILRSLKEKETLLAEIHHRVKNNLAIVSGMMQLQTYQDENPELRIKLMDSVARIQTMAIIHEHLYQSNSFSDINFPDNLQTLVKYIMETFASDVEIDLEFDCHPLILNINQAIPCSLIINEVITNILKHAFTGRSSGKVSISTLKNDDKNLSIVISDNGNGLPKGFKVDSEETLGLLLIKILTDQLGGKYTYSGIENGTVFTLEFELKPTLTGSANTL